MASFQTTATRKHKEALLENRKEQQKRLQSVVDDLDTQVFGMIREIRSLTNAEELSDTQKITKIRELLDHQPTDFEDLKADLEEATGQDRSWFEMRESHSLKLQTGSVRIPLKVATQTT